MRKVRLGIVGASWWTDNVTPGFQLARNAEVTWVAARRAERARQFAEEHLVPHWTTDYSTLMSADDVDAVFVAVPNFLHEEIAIAAMAHDLHVLQEKPMALTVEQAFAQMRVAERRGLVMMVDHEMRLANGIRDLPALFASELGAPRKVRLQVDLGGGEWGGWRGDPGLSGGTFFEMAIHQLDLTRFLFGRDPISVYAEGSDVAGHDLTVLLDFGDGDTALVDYCWRSVGFRFVVTCVCERGSVDLELEMPYGRGIRTVRTESSVRRRNFAANPHGPQTFRRVMEGFAGAVLTGAVPPVTVEDGVWAVRMADAARTSLIDGGKVTV